MEKHADVVARLCKSLLEELSQYARGIIPRSKELQSYCRPVFRLLSRSDPTFFSRVTFFPENMLHETSCRAMGMLCVISIFLGELFRSSKVS